MWREPFAGDEGREIFMTYGLGDSFSPERTMAAFARSAALPLVRPELAGIGLTGTDAPLTANVTVGTTMRTVGLRQYAPPAGVDGHFVSTRSDDGRADATRFVLQALAGETPVIGE